MLPGAWEWIQATRLKAPNVPPRSTFGHEDTVEYEKVLVPTLIVAGAEDKLRHPGFYVPMQERIPDVEVQVVADAGHLLEHREGSRVQRGCDQVSHARRERVTKDEEITSASLAALEQVVDPCSIATGAPITIREMGLVKMVRTTDGSVFVALRLTSPFCLQVGNIVERVEQVIGSVRGVKGVQIEVDPRDEWMPGLMSSAARDRLRRLRPVAPLDSGPLDVQLKSHL